MSKSSLKIEKKNECKLCLYSKFSFHHHQCFYLHLNYFHHLRFLSQLRPVSFRINLYIVYVILNHAVPFGIKFIQLLFNFERNWTMKWWNYSQLRYQYISKKEAIILSLHLSFCLYTPNLPKELFDYLINC